MRNRSRGANDPPRGPQTESAAELGARLVYSLLRAAVRIAARFNLPMDRLVQLAELAYFEELRAKHPRDLSGVAARLGISLRTVGALNRRLKADFFRAETEVEPLRRVTAALLGGAMRLDALERALSDVDPGAVRAALDQLVALDWAELAGDRYQLKSTFRSFVDETLPRRIDALNNQMDILAESVWRRFVGCDDTSAVGRSWALAAKPEAVRAFIDKTIRDLRHGAIDLEESALRSNDFERYGITLAFAKLTPKEK